MSDFWIQSLSIQELQDELCGSRKKMAVVKTKNTTKIKPFENRKV